MSKKKNSVPKTTKTTNAHKRSASSKRARRSRGATPEQSGELAQALVGAEHDEISAGAAVSSDVGDPVPADGTEDTDGADGTHEDGAVPRTRPPIPPVGTVIRKLDRYGKLRCQCTVVANGIRYKGTVYRSLSGAAMAAAGDLGLKNKTQNGYVFWKLVRLTRKITDPVAALAKSWQRYHNVATAALQVATDKNRAQVRAALQRHGQALGSLAGDAGA